MLRGGLSEGLWGAGYRYIRLVRSFQDEKRPARTVELVASSGCGNDPETKTTPFLYSVNPDPAMPFPSLVMGKEPLGMRRFSATFTYVCRMTPYRLPCM